MKMIVERTPFLKALGHVHRVVERRNTIPVLANLLLRAEGGHVSLKATDLDLEMTESVSAEIERAGGATVPAYMLYEIVRKLPDGAAIHLETIEEGSRIQVRAGRSRFELQTLPISDFPDLSVGDFSHHFTLRAKDLRDLIEKTQFCTASDEVRFFLNGICFQVCRRDSHPILRAVATDGHRLAYYEIPAPEAAENMPDIIVPRKSVAEILRLIEDPEGSIDIDLSNTKLKLRAKEVVLISKLIDGTFPEYEGAIPKHHPILLQLPVQEFSSAVDRVSTLASERGRIVKLILSEGKITLTVSNADAGNAEEELEIEYSKDPLEVSFNAKYLLEVASQMEADHLFMRLGTPGTPTLLEDGAQSKSLYVLMPMRV